MGEWTQALLPQYMARSERDVSAHLLLNPRVVAAKLPGEFRARPGIGDRRHTPLSLDDLERQHIDRTLKHHGGNRTRAAAELGISRATLINKIKRYNLTG